MSERSRDATGADAGASEAGVEQLRHEEEMLKREEERAALLEGVRRDLLFTIKNHAQDGTAHGNMLSVVRMHGNEMGNYAEVEDNELQRAANIALLQLQEQGAIESRYGEGGAVTGDVAFRWFPIGE